MMCMPVRLNTVVNSDCVKYHFPVGWPSYENDEIMISSTVSSLTNKHCEGGCSLLLDCRKIIVTYMSPR